MTIGEAFTRALKEAGTQTLAATLVAFGEGVAKVATVTAEAIKDEQAQTEEEVAQETTQAHDESDLEED